MGRISKNRQPYEWEGVAGKPARKVAHIDYDYLQEFDIRQADSAVEYIKQHAKDEKPFFMDVNFMKMHNPNNPDKAFIGKSHLGNYSDTMMELDANIGKVVDAIRAEAPDTIVILTADNGAWQDAWPDAGTTRSVAKKARRSRAASVCPASCGGPADSGRRGPRRNDVAHRLWATLATMVGLTPPPSARWKDNNGKPIYFDSIDNSAYIMGKAKHSARNSWIYVDGESFRRARATSAVIPRMPTSISPGKPLHRQGHLARPKQDLGAIGTTTISPWTPTRNTT